jgi:hypothetical protein
MSRSPWFWLMAAVLGGLLLFAGGLAAWNVAVVPAFGRWATSQLPPDFPVYPGAEYVGVSVAVSDCTYVQVEWQTADSPERVLTFYRQRMAQSPWRLVETGAPQTVAFLGTGRSEVFGRLEVANGGPPTRFRYRGQRPYDAFGHYQRLCLTPNPRQTPTPMSEA